MQRSAAQTHALASSFDSYHIPANLIESFVCGAFLAKSDSRQQSANRKRGLARSPKLTDAARFSFPAFPSLLTPPARLSPPYDAFSLYRSKHPPSPHHLAAFRGLSVSSKIEQNPSACKQTTSRPQSASVRPERHSQPTAPHQNLWQHVSNSNGPRQARLLLSLPCARLARP